MSFCGSKKPVMIADEICINHKISVTENDENACPITPNINAGPALLQNPIRRIASILLIAPRSYDSETIFAPTG